MDLNRVFHTFGMCLCLSGQKRARYLKKHNILRHIGSNCMVMFRKIPLYPKLISIGNNVWIASGVSLITHDVTHYMLNNLYEGDPIQEYIGCIEIKDNVFVGSNTSILPNVAIGPNAVVAAGSIVNKSISNGVFAGVPARYIGSFEEFAKKRMNLPRIEIVKKKGVLTEKTVEEIWADYKKKTRENNREQ